MRKNLILCWMWFLVVTGNGQNIDRPAQLRSPTIGFELDALPFITGGYYGSVWVGSSPIRIRGVVSKVNVPQFILEDGFKDNKLLATALILDYFFQKDLKGFWVGSGLEYWKSSIHHSQEVVTGNYQNFVFTFGGGYVWKFYEDFYLNPWAAVHLVFAGDREVEVGTRTFRPKFFSAEVSLKIGWYF